MAERKVASADPEFITISQPLENGDILHRQAVRVPLGEVFKIEQVEQVDV
jgi:hypothetical protein